MADNDDVDMSLLFTAVYCQSMLFTSEGIDAALPPHTPF
jgi:hypothetical protein